MEGMSKTKVLGGRWPTQWWSLISTGASAALIGFISTFFIVLQGFYTVGASASQAVSALAMLCLFQGFMGIGFSLATRKPYAFAWSTPGSAILLSYNQLLSGFAEAVGAFCMSGGLMLGMAMLPNISRYLEKIPASLSSAMLAGVLLSLAKSFVPAFEQYPLIVGIVAFVWLLLFIFKPLFAAGLVSLLSVIPSPVILALAALALFGTLADALRDALRDELHYPAIATVIITVYFPNFFHVSSSFWGLLLGTLFYWVLSKKKLG